MADAYEFKRLRKSEIGEELTTPPYRSDLNDL